jgi:hypothetical protein
VDLNLLKRYHRYKSKLPKRSKSRKAITFLMRKTLNFLSKQIRKYQKKKRNILNSLFIEQCRSIGYPAGFLAGQLYFWYNIR